MNFFSKWGKSKISSKSYEDSVHFEPSSAKVDSNSSITKLRTNVRNIYRRKHLNMTRSLFYDTENIDVETNTKMKKAQSCNNLDSLEDEILNKDVQSIVNKQIEKQEIKSSIGLKKFFSLENLSGKKKLTKDMISEPSLLLNKISEEDNELPETHLKETSKLLNKKLEQKSNDSVEVTQSKLRRSFSLGSLLHIRDSLPVQPPKLVHIELEPKSSEDGLRVSPVVSKPGKSGSMRLSKESLSLQRNSWPCESLKSKETCQKSFEFSWIKRCQSENSLFIESIDLNSFSLKSLKMDVAELNFANIMVETRVNDTENDFSEISEKFSEVISTLNKNDNKLTKTFKKDSEMSIEENEINLRIRENQSVSRL